MHPTGLRFFKIARSAPLSPLRKGVFYNLNRSFVTRSSSFTFSPLSMRTPVSMTSIPLSSLQRRYVRVGGPKTTTQTITREQEEQQQQQASTVAQAQQQTQVKDYSNAPTAAAVLQSDAGLQSFVSRVMGNTAAGLAITAVCTAPFLMGVLPIPSMGVVLGVGLVGGIACLIGSSMIQPTHFRDTKGYLNTTNPPLRMVLAGAFCAFQGVAIAPLLAMCPAPCVFAAGLVTAGVVAGMGAFALSRPSGSMLSWGGPLFVGVLGLVGCGLGAMLLGPGSMVGSALFWISSIGGVGIFAAFTAYDTQRAIEEYRNGFADHLGHAINMYLNILNLFKNILLLLRVFWDE